MENEQLLDMIKDLLTERLGPVMERLEKLEDAHKAMEDKGEDSPEEPVEASEDGAEGEDKPEEMEAKEHYTEDEKKEEEKTEAMEEDKKDSEEPKEMKEEDKEEEKSEMSETVEAVDPRDAEIAALKASLEGLKELSELHEKTIADLKAEAVKKDAAHTVAAALADKPHLSQMSERLVDLYINDKDLYNDIVNIKGGGMSSLSERSTKGLAPVATTKKVDIYDEAFRLQKAEGISYADAIAKLTK